MNRQNSIKRASLSKIDGKVKSTFKEKIKNTRAETYRRLESGEKQIFKTNKTSMNKAMRKNNELNKSR